jgi:hypothetical protein
MDRGGAMASALQGVSPRKRRKPGQAGSFTGSFDQLCQVVSATGALGHWEPMPNDYFRFVCKSGAIFNWWPSTGTFNFQGPPDAAAQFKSVLAETVDRLFRATPGRLTDARR